MPDGNYWIGLKYDYDYVTWEQEWKWEDDSTLNFDNWAQSEPKEDTYINDRVYLNKATGRWFSSTVYVDLPLICERWPKGQPTPPPEPIKQGGCPDGWYPYFNRCYKYEAFKVQNSKYRTKCCTFSVRTSVHNMTHKIFFTVSFISF